MAMSPKEKQRLIASWLTLQSTHTASSGRDLSWVVQKVWDLCDDAPNEAFQFIVGVLEQDGSSRTMAILSAGPFEALLRKHGPRIIDRVERKARHDPQFVRLLEHVWKNSVSDRIWIRVQRARDRPRLRTAHEA